MIEVWIVSFHSGFVQALANYVSRDSADRYAILGGECLIQVLNHLQFREGGTGVAQREESHTSPVDGSV